MNMNLSAAVRAVRSLNHFVSRLAVLSGLLFSPAWVEAADIAVPNYSFESPTTPPGFPAFPVVDSWQKAPEPPGVPLPPGVTWDQLAGVFPNTAPGSPDHIDNVDGAQAAYMFAVPGVALFQDSFGPTYEVGMSYSLTVGILGGGGITEGSTFQISLYYRDGGNNIVNIASTPVTYTAAGFPTATHLIDFNVALGEVQSGDAWVGRNIGIQLLASGGTGAGYWDLDNVRLSAVPEPGTVALLALGLGGLAFTRWRMSRRS